VYFVNCVVYVCEQIISSVLQEIVNSFVNDRSSSEVMAVGSVQLLLLGITLRLRSILCN